MSTESVSGCSLLRALRAAACAVVGAIPIAYVRMKRSKRLAKFEDQLPDAIDLFTRTMRSATTFTATSKQFPPRPAIRVRMAEAAIGKAGIKMLFPIIFISPVLFVIALVPGLISVLHDMELLGIGKK